jgi:hypothetical protein
MRHIILFGLLIAISQRATADSLELRNGKSLECTVLHVGAQSVAILDDSGIKTVPRSTVAKINRDEEESQRPTTRLPDYLSLAKTVAAQSWATDLKQVPVAPFNDGVFRNVACKSVHAGRNYVINVYGDPKSPAGFEVGLIRTPAHPDEARENCIECVCKLLGEPDDRQIVRSLSRERGATVRAGMTFEIIPSTDPDAHGGWWVAVHDEKALVAAREAMKESLAKIAGKQPIVVSSGSSDEDTDGLDDPFYNRNKRPRMRIPGGVGFAHAASDDLTVNALVTPGGRVHSERREVIMVDGKSQVFTRVYDTPKPK